MGRYDAKFAYNMWNGCGLHIEQECYSYERIQEISDCLEA
jgi:hypothetical protein